MGIGVGFRMPEATLLKMGAGGVEQVPTTALFGGRRVVLFGLPGAYTGTCSTLHVPGFIRVADRLRAAGVDEIVCLATDTPHVMAAWGEATGATAAGITMLSDPGSAFTLAIGMAFDAPAVGFFNRSKRYSALVEDGTVTRFNPEPPGGQCDVSGGETMLAQVAG